MADGSADRLDSSIDSSATQLLDTTDPNLASTAPPPTTPLPLSSSSHANDHQPSLTSNTASPNSSSLPSLSDLSALSSYFDIPATAAFIHRHKASRIALQFPDSLLAYSSVISHLLTASSSSHTSSPLTCYVLADTAFSSCCVDVTAAAHVAAEVVVHYGLACLSCQYRLPVHYVFGRAPLDVEAVAAVVTDSGWQTEDERRDGRGVLLFSDLEYEWAMGSLREAVNRRQQHSSSHRTIVIATVQQQQQRQEQDSKQAEQETTDESKATTCADSSYTIDGHHFTLPASTPLSSFTLVFLCSAASPLLTDLMLNYNSLPAYLLTLAASTSTSAPSYQIEAASSSASIRRTLSRRYYLTQHLLSARIYGLLVTALSHSALLSTLSHVKRLITAADKRSYTFMMGKPNPSKLANIAEVDVWVVLGCPFSALLGGSQGRGEYFRELVTPVELEMGLTGRLWTGDYCTDMATVGRQSEGQQADEHEDGERKTTAAGEEEEEVVFDSATGKLRSALPSFNRVGTQLVVREEGQLVRSAADVMKERSWKGLETEADRRARLEREQADAAADGVVAVKPHIDLSTLEHGLQGIASQYSKDERHVSRLDAER